MPRVLVARQIIVSPLMNQWWIHPHSSRHAQLQLSSDQLQKLDCLSKHIKSKHYFLLAKLNKMSAQDPPNLGWKYQPVRLQLVAATVYWNCDCWNVCVVVWLTESLFLFFVECLLSWLFDLMECNAPVVWPSAHACELVQKTCTGQYM